MTPQQRFDAIKKIHSEYENKMDTVRKEYRMKIRELFQRVEQQRIAKIKQSLHQ